MDVFTPSVSLPLLLKLCSGSAQAASKIPFADGAEVWARYFHPVAVVHLLAHTARACRSPGSAWLLLHFPDVEV